MALWQGIAIGFVALFFLWGLAGGPAMFTHGRAGSTDDTESPDHDDVAGDDEGRGKRRGKHSS